MKYRVVFLDEDGSVRRTSYSSTMVGAMGILATNVCPDWLGHIERIDHG